MHEQSIPALLARLVRLRTERLRAHPWTPRRPFVLLAITTLAAAVAVWPEPQPPEIPGVCFNGPDRDWRMAPAPDDPIAQLVEANTIGGRENGEDGQPSPTVTAYHQILGREDAADVFRSILHEAHEIEGQVYAACGLMRSGAHDEGQRALDRMVSDRRMVTLQGGCTWRPIPIDVVLSAYGSGYGRYWSGPVDPAYSEDFTRILISQHNPAIAF